MNVNEFIGVPFLDKGRDFNGVDCWGLCHLFYKHNLGIIVPTYVGDYETAHSGTSVSTAIKDNVGNWEEVDELQFGDVILFRILGVPFHTGIYIGGDDFLHSWRGTHSCVERLSSITWNKRFIKAYRWNTN